MRTVDILMEKRLDILRIAKLNGVVKLRLFGSVVHFRITMYLRKVRAAHGLIHLLNHRVFTS